jgi:hypothetical protein
MCDGKFRITIALLLAAFSINSYAQEQVCEPASHQDSSYWEMLGLMNAVGCFNIDRNDSALAQSVTQALNSSEKKYQRALQALTSIQQDLLTKTDSNSAALNAAIESLKDRITNNPALPENGLTNRWKLGNRLDRLPDDLDQIDFQSPLQMTRCELVSNGQCKDEFETASSQLRAIYLAYAALNKYTENYREESYAERSLRRAKWDSYYDDLTFQYPWELAVNSILLERSDSRAVEDGNKKGFRDLPESKLVFLHPEANLVYANNAADEYEITLTVEAIGYETFDFDSKGKVKDVMGISLLATYMDQADVIKSGWTAGLLFKYNGYSLGVTDNHGDTGIVFNINLSQRIFDVKGEGRRYYDGFKEKIDYMGKLVEEGKDKLEDARRMYRISE